MKTINQFRIAIFHKSSKRTYYAYNEGQKSLLTRIRETCVKQGLTPLFLNSDERIKKELKKFNITKIKKLFLIDNTEVFISKKKPVLMIIKTGRGVGLDTIHIVFLYKKEANIKRILVSLRKIKKIGKVKEGTYAEATQREDFNNNLKTKSANGKLIEDKKLKEIFTYLLNKDNRKIISEISSICKLGPKSKEEILSSIKNFTLKDLGEILHNKKFFIKIYRIKCCECNRILFSMNFSSRKQGERALSNSSFRCLMRGCPSKKSKSRKAEIIEVFSLTKEALMIRSGVWLEKLVDDELRRVTSDTWPCRFHNNDELDNIFIFREKFVLVECKDTSFGQNDLYNIVMKARNLAVNHIIIVTTKKIHKNVLTRIKIFNEDEEENINIVVISGMESEIRRKLEIFFQRANKQYLDNLLEFDTDRRLFRRRAFHHRKRL